MFGRTNIRPVKNGLKEGSLAALLIGDSNLRHVDRLRLDQNGKIHVRTVGGAIAGDFQLA